MPLTTDEKLLALSHDIIAGFDKVDGGIHPGFRPAHAKGILLTGAFTPSAKAASLTIARRHSLLFQKIDNPSGDPLKSKTIEAA